MAHPAEHDRKQKSLKARLPALTSVIDEALRKSLPVPPDQWDNYTTDLLRRLGVRAHLDSFEERWVQLQGIAEALGIQAERIQQMTPNQLCAALEHEAHKLKLLEGAQPATKPPIVYLLECIVAEQKTTIEEWGRVHGITRTVLYDWKRLLLAGHSLRGTIRETMDLKIRSAIETDAKALGLSLPSA